MTKADLVEKVTRLGDLTRRDGEVIVETVFDSVISALQSGDKIEIRGFGSFPHSPAQSPHWPQPKNRRTRGSSRQARSLLQAVKGTAGPRESRGNSTGNRFLTRQTGSAPRITARDEARCSAMPAAGFSIIYAP